MDKCASDGSTSSYCSLSASETGSWSGRESIVRMSVKILGESEDECQGVG